uniref:Uncharacterized protein n=1 Tax=Oryza brachyantha TaxID=4533 RepID=J3L2D4_ORYBR
MPIYSDLCFFFPRMEFPWQEISILASPPPHQFISNALVPTCLRRECSCLLVVHVLITYIQCIVSWEEPENNFG